MAYGIWHFGDSAARAEVRWWEAFDAHEVAQEEARGLVRLFDIPNISHRNIKDVETEARPVIAENIARLAEEHGRFKVGEYPGEVFGDYLGTVRETVVRAAIKDLHKSGRTPSDGVGKRITDLVVTRQPR
jgi:hypothetical protein